MTNHSADPKGSFRQAYEYLKNNRNLDALKLAQKMCEDNPLDTDSWMLQAASHAALGNMNDVVHCCEKTLEIEPGHSQARHNLGVALGNIGITLSNTGAHDEAIQHLKRLLALQPESADAHAAIGRAYLAANDARQALWYFKQAEKIQPGKASHSFTTGRCLEILGNTSEAEKAYRDTIRKDPFVFEAHNNLAGILQSSGRLGEALEYYSRAITLKPATPELHYNKCLCLHFSGQTKDAVLHGLRAFNLAPEKLEIRQALAQAFSSYHGKADPEWEQALSELFTSDFLDFQLLHGVSNDLVLQGLAEKIPGFSGLTTSKLIRILSEAALCGKLGDITGQPLFNALLTRTICCTTSMETFLSALRTALLQISTTITTLETGRTLSENILDSACALACQCYSTEYIYSLDDREQENLNTLLQSTTELLSRGENPDTTIQLKLAILACYKSLHEIDGIQAFRQHYDQAEPCFKLVLERQLLDHLQEQALRDQIDSLTPITDTTSELVREQYEDHPYPRWLSFSKLTPRPPQKIIGELFPWFKPPSFPREEVRILIAGCGTGRHAMITASRFDNCKLLAVDLSRSSLAYAMRMAQSYGVDNIKFSQADILGLAGIKQTFHIIESVGVLHHMKNPAEGLKVLASLLEPDGLMNIGLYSKAGRHHILAAQKLFREQGHESDIEDIRAGRQSIKNLASTHPAYDVINMQDFYSTSECRDLLLHVQEYCYDLAEIETMLAESGLEFIGFEFRDPTGKLKFQSVNHAPDDQGNLQKWKHFEQKHPETFLEMYIFWCKKSG